MMNISLIFIIISNILLISSSNDWSPFYNLYHTDIMTTQFAYDCFYLTITYMDDLEEKPCGIKQIMEYCIRMSSKAEIDVNEQSITSKLTFNELKKRNVTSHNLVEWSSSIDLAERYEYFLQTNTSLSSKELFYNCTLPWFGSYCQYKFPLNESFFSILQTFLIGSRPHNENPTYTCYVQMKCEHHSLHVCLDWREICDGKIDCLDSAEDEKYCLELEMNQCEENEYQCRNGMCINEEFLLDNCEANISPECLDGSDEILPVASSGCTPYISFRCEDLVCPFPFQFTCGDGQCIPSLIPASHAVCATKRMYMLNFLLNWDQPEDTRFPHCFKTLLCGSDRFSSDQFDIYCKNMCQTKSECQKQTIELCSPAFTAPTFPIYDGHIRYGYSSNQTFTNRATIQPSHVCYNQDLCPFLIPTIRIDNYTCIHVNQLNLPSSGSLLKPFNPCNRRRQYGNATHCPQSNLIHCLGTDLCIPKRRIMDGIIDCDDGFDESALVNSCSLDDKYRFQCTSEQKCLAPFLVGDNQKQCVGGEDEFQKYEGVTNIHQLHFSAICNNNIDLFITTNETDETDCDDWPCVNQYTRCNTLWNCPKGIDEVNCSSIYQCAPNYHPCFFAINHTIGCLHIDYVEDGIIHCLGGTDERSCCRSKHPNDLSKRYRCWNDTRCSTVGNRCSTCKNSYDIDQLCNRPFAEIENITLLLGSVDDTKFYRKIPFSHHSSPNFPSIQLLPSSSTHEYKHNYPTEVSKIKNSQQIDGRYFFLCHRGIPIFVGKNETEQCFCPSNYYGQFCQYQNQRIALTIRLRQESLNKLHIVALVIRLIDHTGFIHSYEQITYTPIINCNTKYNIYLLYQDQPKDMTKNYTIYIDAYNKISLTYLKSWILSIKHLFLPVNRVSVQLIIPVQQDRYLMNSIVSNKKKCDCSPDSICIGYAHNRSICICSLHKMGSRCYLHSICRINICMNQGVCVPDQLQNYSTKFKCVCPDGYSGEYCEKKDVRIDISFSNVAIPKFLFVHFIYISPYHILKDDPMPLRSTMFKKILFNQNIITLHISLPFHLTFVQIETNYYLIILQHQYISSINISTEIIPSQQCQDIKQLLNETIVQYSILHRVKYYHLICKQHLNLVCFHDNEIFMCLCTEERHANCFHFDFNMTYNCWGHSICHHEGECFQDHPNCPTKTICVCPDCFYGDKCQFSTNNFGLTLDSILGYHIHPYQSIIKQSIPVIISIIISTFMLIIGLISGILSNLTFQTKFTREVGCGFYLFASSITSILTIIFLNIKLWLLIFSQMNMITSRYFLLFQCISLEFILRFLLPTTDWYHSCVTIERFLVVFQGARFNKIKSKQIAKIFLCIIPLLVSISIIHDPIHRRLIDDLDEQRTWCFADLTPKIAIYNRLITIFHFIIPFSLNLILVMTTIIITARKHSNVKTQITFIRQLQEEFHHQKHLILSAILLIILALPRLIISFLQNCMKSPRDYQVYLAGYFVSFIPPLLHFFIFVLTSKMYKKEFKTTIQRKWKAFRRQINRNTI